MFTMIKEKLISVPTNVDDSTTLKRFLTDLVAKLNTNPLVTYPITYGVNNPTVPTAVLNILGAYTSNLLDAAVKTNAITEEAKTYITNTLTTQVLANEENLAVIAQQFGAFKDLTTAAAWYGLTVKSGELISGFTVSGVDTDTTTPGTAGSTFAISADNFSVAKAISDITNPSELAYVQAHNLPYGTMYDTNTSKIIPAFLIQWNGASYDIIFNGKVSFTNTTGNLDTSRIINSAGWTDNTVANTAITNAATAQTTANTASTNATAALSQLTNIASDNILSPVEKSAVVSDKAVIDAEQTGIDAQATAYGITTEKTTYDNAVSALTTYLGTLTAPVAWNVTTGDTTIVGDTFRTKFTDVYAARQTLLNAIYTKAKALADAAQSAADAKLPSNADLAALINANTTTIDGGKITALSILAAAIAANTITGNKLAANTITANNIAALTITANELAANAVTAAKVAANAITADKISVSTLSAICANIGTITAGTINADVINTGTLFIDRIPVITSAWRYSDPATITLSANNTWTTFAQVTLTIDQTLSIDVTVSFNDNKGNNTVGINLRILRDSTLVYGDSTINSASSLWANSTYASNVWTADTLFFNETLSAGTYTYYAQFATSSRSASPYQAIRNRNMTATVFHK